MKTSTRIAICLVLMMALGAGGLQAQDEKDWSVSFDNAFTSKYIWRGQNLSNTASMQPGMTFGYKGLSVSSWSNNFDGRYSNEVYGGVSVDTILQPSFAVYGDMHNGNGMYYTHWYITGLR